MSGPLPGALLPLTIPASWIYGWAVARRNARFDRGPGVTRFDRPVISIGNLTTGGSGKTPMVAWVVERLRERGQSPVIAMRGYGAVPGELSDEQAEYAERLPGTPVVANPDRAAAVRAFLAAHPSIHTIVLDDGFQHRQMARDLDLVLIDATQNTLDDRLLPAGHLREPLANLARADAVIVTRSAGVDERLSERIARHHKRPPIAWSRHAWTGLRVVQGEERDEPVAWLAGRRVVTMLGVGNPGAVGTAVEAAGARVLADLPVRDHERYDRRKLMVAQGLCTGAEALFVTGKDWVKIRALINWHDWPVPVVIPRLEIEVFDGEPELRAMIERAASRSTSAIPPSAAATR